MFLIIICSVCILCFSVIISSIILSNKTSTTRGIVVAFLSIDVIFAVIYMLYFTILRDKIDELLGNDKDVVMAVFLIASISSGIFTFMLFLFAIVVGIFKFIKKLISEFTKSKKKDGYNRIDNSKLDVDLEIK